MNSLKLIDKLIMDHKINIDIHKGILLIDDSKKFFHNKVIKENEESINVLRQIKSELKTLQMLKDKLGIGILEVKIGDKTNYILCMKAINDEFTFEEYEIAKNVLEVTNNEQKEN